MRQIGRKMVADGRLLFQALIVVDETILVRARMCMCMEEFVCLGCNLQSVCINHETSWLLCMLELLFQLCSTSTLPHLVLCGLAFIYIPRRYLIISSMLRTMQRVLFLSNHQELVVSSYIVCIYLIGSISISNVACLLFIKFTSVFSKQLLPISHYGFVQFMICL